MTHTRIGLNFFGEGREPIVPPPAPCNVAYFELGKERLLLQRGSVPNVLRRLHPVRLECAPSQEGDSMSVKRCRRGAVPGNSCPLETDGFARVKPEA